MIALWVLIALAAAAFFFILGWSACHQSQKDARDASHHALDRMLASNGVLIKASHDEANMAERLEQAAKRFEDFAESQRENTRVVDALAERQDVMFNALAAQGLLARDVSRQPRQPRARFSGQPRDPAAPPPLDPPGKPGGGALDTMLG